MSVDTIPTHSLLHCRIDGKHNAKGAIIQVGNTFFILPPESSMPEAFCPVEDYASIQVKPDSATTNALRKELGRLHRESRGNFESNLEFPLLVRLAAALHLDAGVQREEMRPRWTLVFGSSGLTTFTFEQTFAEAWHALAQVVRAAANDDATTSAA
jgi:hypothetical protein